MDILLSVLLMKSAGAPARLDIHLTVQAEKKKKKKILYASLAWGTSINDTAENTRQK